MRFLVAFSGLLQLYALSSRMLRQLIAIAAWACLAFIVHATLSSAGARPELTRAEPALAVFVERFGAYALVGLLFCLSYPRRIVFVCFLVFGSAVFLEFLQIFIPDRDARIFDAAEKIAGGAAGILTACIFLSFLGRGVK
jgi:VanZ family protein